MSNPSDDVAELGALVARLKASDSTLDMEAAIDRCRALYLRLAGRPNVPPVDDGLLDALDELADVAKSAQVELDQGVTEYYGHRTKWRLDEAVEVAAALGVDVERYRRMSFDLTVGLERHELIDILFAIDHGERPPDDDDRWTMYENAVPRMRAHGIDVTRLAQALERARYVESCWARGVDPDTEEDEDDDDVDDQGGEARASVQLPRREADPSAQEKSGTPSRALVEAHLRRLGTLDGGEGRDTFRDILWALLALGEGACVRLEGPQRILIDHLLGHGLLPKQPSERAARSALRKLLANSPFVELRSRLVWVYHLDQLWAPAAEFIAKIEV